MKRRAVPVVGIAMFHTPPERGDRINSFLDPILQGVYRMRLRPPMLKPAWRISMPRLTLHGLHTFFPLFDTVVYVKEICKRQ